MFELAPAIVELGAIAVCIGLILTRKIWVQSFGALLEQAAAWIRDTPQISVLGHSIGIHAVADVLDGINSYALALLGSAIGSTEWAAKKLWHELAYWVEAQAEAVERVALDAFGALRQLRRWTVPFLIGASLGPLSRAIAALQAELRHLNISPTRIVNKTVEVTSPAIHVLERQVAALQKAVKALPVALPSPPAAITFPHVGDITKGLDSIRDQLLRTARILTPAGILGLAAGAVLSGLHLGWAKCSNVERVGKQLCGMDRNILEGLLTGLLALFATFSLPEFVKFLQPVVGEVGSEVTHFWRADIEGAGTDRAIGSPGLTKA